MADLIRICNRSFRKAAREIVKPTVVAGGNDGAVMTVLELTITAVLLTLYKDPRIAAAMLEEGLVPGVTEQLARHGAKGAAGDAKHG